MPTIQITSLHVYPVKSCGIIDVQEWPVDSKGMVYDRNWMVVEPNGQKITQREEASMALVQPELTAHELILHKKGQASLTIPLKKEITKKQAVEIWGHHCEGLDEGDEAAKWISSAINQNARLVRFDPNYTRLIDPVWRGHSSAHTGFADVTPYHICSEESLQAVNEMRKEEGIAPCEMSRFRPNIVIKGLKPFGEDDVPAFRFTGSNATIEITRPCNRCPITNIDQKTGIREKQGNLQILSKKRLLKDYRGKPGAMFGVQGFGRNCEGRTIKVGDTFEIVELSPGLPPFPRLSPAK